MPKNLSPPSNLIEGEKSVSKETKTEEICSQIRKGLFNYFYFILGRNTSEAEELTQSALVFLIVYLNNNGMDSVRSPLAFLKITFSRKIIDTWRKEKGTFSLDDENNAHLFNQLVTENDIIEKIQRDQQRMIMFKAIRKFKKDKYKKIIILRIEEFSNEESAVILNMSLKDFRTSMNIALNILRRNVRNIMKGK